jgi:hypothetical protein
MGWARCYGVFHVEEPCCQPPLSPVRGLVFSFTESYHHISTGSPPLLVHNRTPAKSEKLVKEVGEHRARIAQSPGEVALECDVIFTNLASDEVVRSIYKEFAAALAVSGWLGNAIVM